MTRTSRHAIRPTAPNDDGSLAELLKASYAGTIDDDPDHDYLEELRDWRRDDHADDEASRVVISEGQPIACCLIAFDLGAAFIYEVATHPDHLRRGLAAELIGGSVEVLAQRGIDSLWAWVTDGNLSSERLLGSVGFLAVTPPVDATAARLLYRAAAALDRLDTDRDVPVGARIGPDLPELVLFGGDAKTTVDSHGTSVNVRSVALNGREFDRLVKDCMPVRHASFLLDARREAAQAS